MPTYTYRCGECGKRIDNVLKISEISDYRTNHCGFRMKRIINWKGMSYTRSPFDRGEFEHISNEPKSFRDKHEMADYCNSVGVTSRYLEDGDIP